EGHSASDEGIEVFRRVAVALVPVGIDAEQAAGDAAGGDVDPPHERGHLAALGRARARARQDDQRVTEADGDLEVLLAARAAAVLVGVVVEVALAAAEEMAVLFGALLAVPVDAEAVDVALLVCREPEDGAAAGGAAGVDDAVRDVEVGPLHAVPEQ